MEIVPLGVAFPEVQQGARQVEGEVGVRLAVFRAIAFSLSSGDADMLLRGKDGLVGQ